MICQFIFVFIMYFRESIDTLDGGMIELDLDSHLNKTGDVWHICIEVLSVILLVPDYSLSMVFD